MFESRLDRNGADFAENRDHALGLIAEMRAIEARTRAASAKAGPRFTKRGQILPRERLALLLDDRAPFLEVSTLAGFLLDSKDPAASVPGGGFIAGIGFVSGVRVMVAVDDSGIEAGALQPMGLEKFKRAQAIALKQKLPFLHLVESAGANLMRYKVEDFVHGGGIYASLARLSAAGIPVLTLVHGASAAGGAYMPGLSDTVVMVRDRGRAYLAGPALLEAATGEIADDEELGGALMHASVSGLAEYLAEDDADGVRILREIVSRLGWDRNPLPEGPAPRLDAEDLLGIMPKDGKRPVDMREVVARLTDLSDFLEFKPLYGPATLCIQGRIMGHEVGFVSNNGPLDPDGSAKATHFIQTCCRADTPLVYLQNTTGYMVGTASERAGMIKHGSKMIQAVANASVPQITIACGGSFGAGNYGMCGRGFDPDFLFHWPSAKTSVMGGEQAARTMEIVMAEGARKRGIEPDPEAMAALRGQVVLTFEKQHSAFYTSGRMLDDGVIDPRDTRAVLALALDICRTARARTLRPLSFGVARP